MDFFNSYKHLDKICGEVYNDRRGISAYIDEMSVISNGDFYVVGWEEDLKRLKHYRWVRNQIAHDTSCTEENMCIPEDARWIDGFYRRIMNQTDPLALYRKATQTRNATIKRNRNAPETNNSQTVEKKLEAYFADNEPVENTSGKEIAVAVAITVVAVAVALCLLLL